MSALPNPWSRWVAAVSAPVDARILGLIRILLAACVVVDLLLAGGLGLVDILWVPYEQGGLSKVQDPSLWVDDFLGESTGVVLYGLSVASMALVALGIGGRPVQLFAILCYAQLGHLYPPGDRGVDRVIRTGLFLLLFSKAHQSLSLGRRLRGKPQVQTVSSAVPWMLRILLANIYLSAGIAKLMTTDAWLQWKAWPVLYRVLSDPMAAKLDPLVADDFMWVWNLGAYFTIALELSAPLLLTRWSKYWAAVGLGLHLGIASMMHLGMFAWGMMSLYPVLMIPWMTALLNRLMPRNRLV